MTDDLGTLPSIVRNACIELREGLKFLLGEDLVALWAYGAATFADRPNGLGDVDTYGILASHPNRETVVAIEQLHAVSADAARIEWDSWYVLEANARFPQPPTHAFRNDLVDLSWALHRAHWLAGQYVGLSGRSPHEIVPSPTWPELRNGLDAEFLFMERLLAERRDESGESAFLTWNACRIIYSLETRDVVVSKKAASRWALEHLPDELHQAIRAAGRVYDGVADGEDEAVLRAQRAEIVDAARMRIALEKEQAG